MRVAVTHACIFIDPFEIDLINSLFQLNLEIHTSVDVNYELNATQQQVLKAYVSVGKLTLHSMHQEDRKLIQTMQISKALSSTDKSVLYLAQKLNALLLSSDKALRNIAEVNSVECHGMMWSFDQWVAHAILTMPIAAKKLLE